MKIKTSKNKQGKISVNKITLSLIITIIIIMAAYVVVSVSFSDNPSINPTTPDTTDNLNCSWIPSADTTQTNVSWYKNSILFLNSTISINYSVLPYQNTSKNQVWICNVTLSNGTNTTTMTDSITITNSPPQEPNVYNSSSQDIGSTEVVYEDQTYIYDINATDPDGDTLTFRRSPSSAFCTVTDEDTGAVSCSPTADDLGANNTIGQLNITFWADDTDPFFPTSKGHTVLFNVTPVNDDPSFSPALTNQTINESQIFNYYISATDEESNIPYNFTFNVTPNLDLTITQLNTTSAIIQFNGNRTASYSEGGNYTINVTVVDNENGSATSSFNLAIGQVNIAPLLTTIPVYDRTQGESIIFTVTANDPDENDTLNFTIVPNVCTISNPWTISTTNSSRNATGLVNVTNLTNNHVICRNVTITVIDDAGAEDFQDVFLNISNTNDPPNIEVLSSHSNNTGNNISNLTSYANAPFFYFVNVTDVDNLTYEGEIITYSDNASFFNISSTTGIINFTPAQSDVGNHTINITATDDGGLIDSQIMIFEIKNNSAPVLSTIGNLSCAEDNLCFFAINATDADGDNMTFSSNNTILFNLTDNNTVSQIISAYINNTPNQTYVGNHSITVTVTDSRGATDNETFILEINNTNDAPVLQSFSFPTKIVETHAVSFYVQANDEDYDIASKYTNVTVNGTDYSEYVTFNDTNITGRKLFNITTYLNTSNNKTYAQIIFTPQMGDAGNYSVNITVTDFAGEINWAVKNFTVLNKTNAPNITAIMPYGAPVNSTTVFNWTNTSEFNGSTQTAVSFNENRYVFYNISVTDDTTATENLTYKWYIDGTLNSTAASINLSYDYFSAGEYNITVYVLDDKYENSSWTWNVTVSNVNRRPKFLNNLEDLSVNSTTVYTDYLKKTTAVHFIDPDDDLNSNNDFNVGEISTLTYTPTTCSVATLTITTHSLQIVPTTVGSCTVYFTAEDSDGETNTSNTIQINVTNVPEEESPTPQPTSGGGGGGSSSAVVIPITREEEIPKSIEIVVPELITIYKNRTVIIPVTIQNKWNGTLSEVSINASTNATGVELELSENYFNEIMQGDKKNITLKVNNYRIGENFEVKITANVTDPYTSDSAIVLLNSIQQSEEGDDVETKVTFAQDLLNENPECSELNELLQRAKEELESGSVIEASRMVDGVIQGCKYLVSISKKTQETPQTIINKFLKKENLRYLWVFLGILTIIIVTSLVAKKRKIKDVEKKEKQEEIAKKEDEIKPYWP